MKYVNHVVSNENVRSFIEEHEEEISQIIKENMTSFISNNFNYIVENINSFIDPDNLDVSYKNIKNFVAFDLMSMISAISEVSALDNSFEHCNAIMDEGVSSVFYGQGYGAQKVSRLISTTYV